MYYKPYSVMSTDYCPVKRSSNQLKTHNLMFTPIHTYTSPLSGSDVLCDDK